MRANTSRHHALQKRVWVPLFTASSASIVGSREDAGTLLVGSGGIAPSSLCASERTYAPSACDLEIPRAVQKGYSYGADPGRTLLWSCSADTGCLLSCLSLCVEVGISPRPITPLLRPSLCGRRWAATSASAVSESVDQVAEWLHRHHVFSSPWQGEGARGPWPWQAGGRTGHSHKHTSECDQGQRTTLLLPWRRLQQ